MAQLIGWLLVVALVVAVLRVMWPFIVVGLVAYVAVKIGKRVVEHHNTVIAARDAARDALCARADRQHAQVLRGNPAGVYGDYPAADLGEFNPTLWVCNQPPARRTYQRTRLNG
ncbi:hypothetical protein [Mycobacterium kyorinense]|uniref:Uncharacterized protein n=1 Tax=Mycobacterium kyorinense TaxID=487514 RepID=A0A1X1XM07_9MYCO|nr:hypothetical protein [Mycobacterium kyorinense]ORV99758.1 hypothetical protein AWC14_11800 [Mycobacterium kyorinense]